MQNTNHDALVAQPGVALIRRTEEKPMHKRIRWSTAALIGTTGTAFAIATLAFASMTDTRGGAQQEMSRIVISPAADTSAHVAAISVERLPAVTTSDESELQMLRTRNRRLEALVNVLRERAARTPAQVIASGR